MTNVSNISAIANLERVAAELQRPAPITTYPAGFEPRRQHGVLATRRDHKTGASLLDPQLALQVFLIA